MREAECRGRRAVRGDQTGREHRVTPYALQAGDRAFAMFAWEEAARYYEAALAVAESTEHFTPHNRAALHYRTGLAYYRDQDVGPCLDHYDKAIEAYRLTGDVRGLAQVLIEKTRVQFTLAAVPYGTLINVKPLEEALEALGESEPGLRGNILATMTEVYWHAKQTDRAARIARRVSSSASAWRPSVSYRLPR